MTTRTRTARRLSRALLATMTILTGCADSDATGPNMDDTIQDDPSFAGISVLSRNVYLGGDIAPILGAADVAQIPVLVGEAWAQIQANDFQARAAAIALEIQETQPDLVGLQEVATFRIQAPGDFLAGNPEAAESVQYDYLLTLLQELGDRGMDYRVVSIAENTDIELPAVTGGGDIIDVRWTDHDVILARHDVEVISEVSGNFNLNLSFPVAGAVPVTILRGYNRVVAEVRGRTYHVINTHPETDETSAQVQAAQLNQLLSTIQGSSTPTVVMGDLNFVADPNKDAYRLMEAHGFADAWVTANGWESEGFTCCFDKWLGEGTLFERIDYVWTRGFEAVADIRIVGGDPNAPQANGRYPSDHAGLYARVALEAGGS